MVSPTYFNLNNIYNHLEKATAPHSSILAWKIPWTEEPGRLQSMGSAKSQTRLSDFTFTFHFHVLEKEMTTHSSILAWRIPGMAEPGGLPSIGSHRVEQDWSDLAAAAAAYNSWLTSLNIIFSRSIHVTTNSNSSFFTMAEQYSIVHIYHILNQQSVMST